MTTGPIFFKIKFYKPLPCPPNNQYFIDQIIPLLGQCLVFLLDWIEQHLGESFLSSFASNLSMVIDLLRPVDSRMAREKQQWHGGVSAAWWNKVGVKEIQTFGPIP